MSVGVDDSRFRKGTLHPNPSREQRRFQRFGVKLPCRVKPRASHQGAALPEFEVETQDVSRGGVFFVVSAEMTRGTTIEFELDLPALGVARPARIRCRGTIARIVPQEAGRIGIGATIDHYKISAYQPTIR